MEQTRYLQFTLILHFTDAQTIRELMTFQYPGMCICIYFYHFFYCL